MQIGASTPVATLAPQAQSSPVVNVRSLNDNDGGKSTGVQTVAAVQKDDGPAPLPPREESSGGGVDIVV